MQLASSPAHKGFLQREVDYQVTRQLWASAESLAGFSLLQMSFKLKAKLTKLSSRVGNAAVLFIFFLNTVLSITP